MKVYLEIVKGDEKLKVNKGNSNTITDNLELSTVAVYVAKFFAQNQVPAVFHVPGGMIAYLTDAISSEGKTLLVTNRHEQASGFAAEGATRISGKSSVAMGTSGPGATNLITAIASSYFDSVPTIFITGQVNSKEIRKNPNQRQNGFQELDIIKLVKGITKQTFSPKTPSEVHEHLVEAWKTANTGRKGPVLIDIPIDLQQKKFSLEFQEPNFEFIEKQFKISDRLFSKVNRLINEAKSPLLLIGGGVRTDNAVASVEAFVENSQIPTVSTLLGRDSNVLNSHLNLGFIGSYGNSWANLALRTCDALIVLGSRLDPRQTGVSVEEFHTGKKIIRVDIDSYELAGRVRSEIEIQSTITNFLEDPRLKVRRRDTTQFTDSIFRHKENFPQSIEQKSELSMNPSEIIEYISNSHKEDWGYIVDVGQHQMWAAQSIKLQKGQRFITSGGLGSMGFALPAAIGISLVTQKRTIVIIGDGCAQLSAPELQTIADLNLPITIYVMNNLQHGMVAQFQEEYLGSRFTGTRSGYRVPDFIALAKAYGVNNSFEISTINHFKDPSFISMKNKSGPVLFEVKLSQEAKALPKLSSGLSE